VNWLPLIPLSSTEPSPLPTMMTAPPAKLPVG
jgi:hypothetical protein